MPPAKPSLDLLRSLSDEHVLRALMSHEPADQSRARDTDRHLQAHGVREHPPAHASQASSRTPASAPPAEAGSGSYFALADDVGCAVAVSIAPEGIVAETVDSLGHSDLAGHPHDHPSRRLHVRSPVPLSAAARQALDAGDQTAVLAVVSAADPVDRHTGRLVHLPDAPFLVGELVAGGCACPARARPGQSSTTTSTGPPGPSSD